jgi:hypothetical protein
VKLISPESLNEVQRGILQGYSRFLPAGAVCVNVIVGEEPWDVRPLVLLGGKVHVVRFSMTLQESRAREISGELEGFSVLFQNRQRVQYLQGEGRFMVTRPFENSTLKEELEKGVISGTPALQDIVRQLIFIVSDLSRRSVAHGHISPANISRLGGEVVLLDPVLGALHQTSDIFLAPETSSGVLPQQSADLYSLGRLIRILLGDTLTPRQTGIVEQLLLPSPRQRPPLVEVAVAFGAQEVTPSIEGEGTPSRRVGGRVVRPGVTPEPAVNPVKEVAVPSGSERPRNSRLVSLGAGAVLVGVVGMYALKSSRPELYYTLASRIPLLAPKHSLEYEQDWASRERARMAVVARAAVLRREPAAIETIVNDVQSGSNPEGVRASLLRVALSDMWQADLGTSDYGAALALALSSLVPDALSSLPTPESLHPGIILAVLGQPQEIPQMRAIAKLPVSTLGRLPEPFGSLFSQLEGMGIHELGDPRAKGLAQIVSGDSRAAAIGAYLGEDQDASQTLARLSLILPVLSANPVAVKELLGVLQDRGGEIASLLGWFDLVELAGWSRVPGIDRLRLVLGAELETRLDDTQWSDLLTFPFEQVRGKAIQTLKRVFPDGQGEKILLTLASPTSGLKREEIIALVSALKLPADKRTPFITAWFELRPSADAVLLLLLARAGAQGNDVFNLEAARYLRKASWKAPIEILTLLAAHSEPLARAIAYGRLDPVNEEDRRVLAGRKAIETDPGCRKVLDERLQGFEKK